MGIIYETNLGVIGSKLAAVEWYSRAGVRYVELGDRETALAALEKLLGRHVDLVNPRYIRNPYFAEAVNASRTVVYDRQVTLNRPGF